MRLLVMFFLFFSVSGWAGVCTEERAIKLAADELTPRGRQDIQYRNLYVAVGQRQNIDGASNSKNGQMSQMEKDEAGIEFEEGYRVFFTFESFLKAQAKKGWHRIIGSADISKECKLLERVVFETKRRE